MKRQSYRLLLAISAAISSHAFAAATDPATGLFFFEEDALPTAITAYDGNAVIDDQRYKDGNHALRWTFAPHATLRFDGNIPIDLSDNITPTTFFAWIYNDTPSEDELLFQFGDDDQVDATFKASLNFQGWRGIAVPYRDMEGDAKDGMNRLTITAPNRDGTLYLDQIMLSVPLDNRWAVPDYNVPFVNPEVNTAVNKHWDALLMYDKMLRAHYPTLNFTAPLNDQDGPAAPLYQHAEQHLGIKNNEQKSPSTQDITQLLDAYRTFAIQDKDGIITGPPLVFPAGQAYTKPEGVFTPEALTHLKEKTNDFRTVGKAMLQTARYLRSNTLNDADRQTLQDEFLRTTRYVLDQGFAAGSGYQIITHFGYQNRELFDAWFLMRHLLQEHDLLAATQQAMMWYTATGRIFINPAQIVDVNVDVLNTQLQWMIKSILLIPDPAQRDALLHQLSNWLSQSILQSQGVAGGFKPDGSIFHHSQHYIAYARDAFGGLAPSVYILSATPYAINEAAQQRLLDSLEKMWVYTKDTKIPIVLSGRHPTGKFTISPEPFKWLALAGDPNNPEQVNARLAAIYARITGADSFAGINAGNEPSGAWAMNYAGMAVQRRSSAAHPEQSWLAVARGFSRYLVGNESYQVNNRYGRYLMYGNLEIIPADINKAAFQYNGWDWNRFPGTTTIHLPWPELKAQLIQLPAAGIEEMLLSTESYLGANQLDDNSMFAMKLHGHSKYHQDDFTARKSVFFFDNRVVALGSGISNNDEAHQTETTLFQHGVADGQAIKVNGQTMNTLGSEQQLDSAATLLDPAGNAYFIPDGYQVDVTYQQQISIDGRTDEETSGDFATAVIRHGSAPQAADYEYAIVIEAGEANNPPDYNVLHKDDQLHAVRDGISGEEDYAYFEALAQDVGGIVLGSDAPTLVMAKPQQQHLALSVVNPDLAFYSDVEADQVDEHGKQREVSIYSRTWRELPSQPQTATVTVKGTWTLDGESTCASVVHADGNSNVQVTTTDAQPCQINLTAS